MRSVLLWKDMDQVAEQMDAAVFQYVGELQTESFEAFADFDLLAFDWYDVRKAGKSGKVLVYIDREDLFFFCRNEAAQQYVQGAVDTLTAGGPLNDQQLLYRFFAGLFKGDMAYLEKLEAQINGGESTILEGKAKDDAPRRIAAWRRELLHLKRYYEQLDAIFDEMCDNDNGLIEADILARLEVLGRRTGRYLQKVCALQELVAQLREAYQSQLAIQQNDLMRVFTIVTVLFLPLTIGGSYECIKNAVVSVSKLETLSTGSWNAPIWPTKIVMSISLIILTLQGLAEIIQLVQRLRAAKREGEQ